MARIRAERTAAVENPTWESIKAMFDHVLILQDTEARERNLIKEEQWAEIAAPTLVVASGKDHSEYMNTAQQVARLIPDAEVVEMAQVRHWPAFEDPETFNTAALRFLRG